MLNSNTLIYPDWAKLSIESEVELTKAYGGIPERHDSFIHVRNPFVPWSGDFNRAINVTANSISGMEIVLNQIKDIHRNNKLDLPNRYDIGSGMKIDITWVDHFSKKRLVFSDAIFMQAESQDISTEAKLYRPSIAEYFDWYHSRLKNRDYYQEEWYSKLKPLQTSFINVFKPYWFKLGSDMIGSVYIAELDGYARLFDVEIDETFRGKGFGKQMMMAIRRVVNNLRLKYVLLETSGDLSDFYTKCDFIECVRSKILWQK
jgi:GNAT superfamily N-acetyltransferase